MACNICETNFQSSQTLVVSVDKSGTSWFLRVGNQGRNIVQINRIFAVRSIRRGWGHHHVSTAATAANSLAISIGLYRTWPDVPILYFERTCSRFHCAGTSRIYRDRRTVTQLPDNNLR
jgi:hypothetical protein